MNRPLISHERVLALWNRHRHDSEVAARLGISRELATRLIGEANRELNARRGQNG